MKRTMIFLFSFAGLLLSSAKRVDEDWGFFSHKKINRLAIFTLPPEMIGFYKAHLQYITEHAIDPDQRRYVLKNEAPRHYIDLDEYDTLSIGEIPKYWKKAVSLYTEDTLQAHGIVPWHIYTLSHRLKEAFAKKDVGLILRHSTDLGHYIADANVPLHTTKNYNGQLSGQKGIHGFWESRLPELFSDSYDLFVGKADYLERPQLTAWEAIMHAHEAVDTLLTLERTLTQSFDPSKKYSFENRGSVTIRVYSYDFSKRYHALLNGMVEQRMKAAIKMIGDFWYTCWINAGQPDLTGLILPTGKSKKNTTSSLPNSSSKLVNHEFGEEVDEKN